MLANGLYKIKGIYGALVADIDGVLVSFPPLYTGNLLAGLIFQKEGDSISFVYSEGPYSKPTFLLAAATSASCTDEAWVGISLGANSLNSKQDGPQHKQQ